MHVMDFAKKIGASRADIENWRTRLRLSTHYAETVPGVARDYSRENVLELAVIAAHVRVGLSPGTAAAYAEAIIRNVKRGNLRRWIVFPAGDYSTAIFTDDLDGAGVQTLIAKSPSRSVVIMDIRAVVDGVERIFSDAAGV